ncbi:MAG: 1-acyl-sn-glycerol-3-phosphate acyltransferase [Bacteroidaceae bacterium]|nr:1-acyl-sn-glycerol-3-phosphate acyltransferase [Bacteroidaceae bacterium]
MELIANFEDIRSYNDNEYRIKAAKLLQEPQFKTVIETVMPEVDYELFGKKMLSLNSIHEFQTEIIVSFLNKLIANTTKGLESEGIENIPHDRNFLYMSNHRDIVLDASFLCMILNAKGYDTCEIAIGSNLLIFDWISDLVRLNKSFIVKRGVGVRQALEAAKQLSGYIHYAINEKKQSIWIAQREGRSKDSNDRTQEALIKMLTLGGTNILDTVRSLNIAPVSISYEYDPCDSLKAYELLQKSKNPDFKKSPKDDLVSMQTGIMGYKGLVHYHFTPCINDELNEIDANADKATVLQSVSQIIDRHIHLNYHIFTNNYIAYDTLYNTNRFAQQYNEDDKLGFEKYIQKQIAKLGNLSDEDAQTIRNTMLLMYSNTLKNKLAAEEQV